jgi:hypothetical protein
LTPITILSALTAWFDTIEKLNDEDRAIFIQINRKALVRFQLKAEPEL